MPGALCYIPHLLCRHSAAGNIFSGFDLTVPCRNNPVSRSEIRMGSKALGKRTEAGPVCSYSSRGSRHVHLLRKPLNWLLPEEAKVYLRTHQSAFALSTHSFPKHFLLVPDHAPQLAQDNNSVHPSLPICVFFLSGAVTNCKQQGEA